MDARQRADAHRGEERRADPHHAGHAACRGGTPRCGRARCRRPRRSRRPSRPRAQTVADYLKHHGACFYDEIVEGTGLLRTQVEDALAELVVVGLVHSDSFAGLRALLIPSDRRKPIGDGKRRRRTALFGIEDAGRWALVRRPARKAVSGRGIEEPDQDVVEHVARTLLRRYGVVFWRLLEREAAWLPPWRDLLRMLRRLEARGEIRGGRFVASVTGEQFALPEAVAMLRETRRAPLTRTWISALRRRPASISSAPSFRVHAFPR